MALEGCMLPGMPRDLPALARLVGSGHDPRKQRRERKAPPPWRGAIAAAGARREPMAFNK